MAETLLSFGVEKLWSLLIKESERIQGVDGQFNGLKSDLNMLRGFLEDADAKKHSSAMVKKCVEEIKEIVFAAEDVIETFLLKEELGRTGGFTKRMRRLPFTIMDHRKLAFDMEGISKRISNVIRDMKKFEVREIIADGRYPQLLQERQREMRHTYPSDNESDFVGLEQNVKKLVGYLVEEESIQVVSICGMGGIGKTTLARQVFNHELVKNSFDGVAWVFVSQQFTRKYVWQTILQRLCSKHRDSDMTEDELQDKLFRLLGTNKYLIVLDDMWKEEDWDIIKPVFPYVLKASMKRYTGWKVLLTSGSRAPTCVTFRPECLTPEESWTLFRRIAFPRKDTAEMEEMGKKMIKHCGGLPLAVKVLGGLLAAQQKLSEWKKVYENIRSSFNDGNRNSVHHILSLSFEELPIYLKQCFLYLAHFPEDYPIKVEDLSWYWAAEGILNPKNYESESIRDVAHVYIEDLVKRNMVMSERDGKTSRFETCQLHDMMREVCLLKAKEENFLQIVHGTSTANSKSPCKTRRIAVHWTDETFNVEGEMKNPSLRSLLFIKQFWGTRFRFMLYKATIGEDFRSLVCPV
ncbi:unnamed protein product [Arabis nemorensis]|uniref:NB-ARC domain-containing protein n=1 Tax=Arabis nemorensis TaxID=586526 RepID=A0A565BEI4_9BRAS|nr:unnamed protein product [Arabis nemorensis]